MSKSDCERFGRAASVEKDRTRMGMRVTAEWEDESLGWCTENAANRRHRASHRQTEEEMRMLKEQE